MMSVEEALGLRDDLKCQFMEVQVEKNKLVMVVS